jgi:hexokinase
MGAYMVEEQNMSERIDRFFEDLGMARDSLDLNRELDRFLDHMKRGLLTFDKGDNLLMIPTYLSLGSKIPLHEPVIVMDAGGTHFRIALVYFDDRLKAVIQDFQRYPMPGTEGEMDKESFYDTIADYMIPYLDHAKKVAFCFSYGTEILPNHDGRILYFSKEVRCEDAEGTLLGESLKETLAKKGVAEADQIQFVVLNDTVAALMGGFAESNAREHSAYTGFVMGTGLNMAYVEENINIQKLRGQIPLLNNMIINTEAGDYLIESGNKVFRKIDERSAQPGIGLLEKQVSGRYQGQVAYYMMEEAIEQGLFSDGFAQAFSAIPEIASADLDNFVRDPYATGFLQDLCQDDRDRELVYRIIDSIFERAAQLVAVVFTAVHIKLGKGRNPTKPIAITMEGSTYYKSDMFRNKLHYYVKKFINEEHGFYNEILHVDHANLIGSAMAALLN